MQLQRCIRCFEKKYNLRRWLEKLNFYWDIKVVFSVEVMFKLRTEAWVIGEQWNVGRRMIQGEEIFCYDVQVGTKACLYFWSWKGASVPSAAVKDVHILRTSQLLGHLYAPLLSVHAGPDPCLDGPHGVFCEDSAHNWLQGTLLSSFLRAASLLTCSTWKATDLVTIEMQ